MSSLRHIVEDPAIVVLAAGNSSRFGSPKQLIEYKGKSLLYNTVWAALQTIMRPVVVVLGSHNSDIRKEMNGLKVQIIHNEQWQEGIASSIRCGLLEIQKLSPGTDGIIFMVSDQPHVDGSLLESLLSTQHNTGRPIVASSYEGISGIPALFHKTLFDELIELAGDTGASKIIKSHPHLVSTVSFPKGIIDIDTRMDYESLLR
jgi:molybdenum cofactor cytidylyltransferase